MFCLIPLIVFAWAATANGSITETNMVGFQNILLFHAPYIPAGQASLTVGSAQLTTVSPSWYPYSYLIIEPDTTGSYIIETTPNTALSFGYHDTMLFLYTSSFDATAPLTNIYAGNDDIVASSIRYSRITTNLTAGVRYYLVITTYRPDYFGRVEVTLTGPGNFTYYNSAPDVASLASTNAYIGTAMTPAGSAGWVDVQLLSTNTGFGDYAGSSLSVTRQGGANTNDVFGFSTNGATFTASGGNLLSGSAVFGTYTNSTNALVINFTSTGTVATHDLVNNVFKHITYQNSYELGAVTLDWAFDDGNVGLQGVGGNGTTNKTQTITVQKTNPTVSPWPTASGISVGQTLANSTLSGGSANVAGSFAFLTPSSAPGAGTNAVTVVFTPDNTNWYNVIQQSVNIVVGKLNQTISFSLPGNKALRDTVILNATASSGLWVSCSVYSGPGVINHGYSLAFTAPGTVVIAASQSGDSTYNPATTVYQTIIVSGAPYITQQPQSVDAVVGGKAQFAVKAGGAGPLYYQWRWNGSPFAGATSDTLSLENLVKANSGQIDVVITNYLGSITSQVANLLVSSYVVWGDDRNGQSQPMKDEVNPKAVTLGWYHDVALYNDGTVSAWGNNTFGQTNVPAGLTGVIAVSAGAYHSLALKADGTVVAWGWGGIGQTNIPAGLTNVIAISAGGFHNLALKSNGQVVGWGYNYAGQCTPPVDLTNAKAISAGSYHSLALKADGTVVAWGFNLTGQGVVPSNIGKAIGIAAGSYHNMVILEDSTVTGWGDNRYLQLDVPADLTDVVKVVCGASHSLALKKDGTVVSWGHNQWLQSEVPDDLTDVKDIAAGGDHSLIILSQP